MFSSWPAITDAKKQIEQVWKVRKDRRYSKTRRLFTNFVKYRNCVGENRKQVRVSVVRDIEDTPEGLSPGDIEQINIIRLLPINSSHIDLGLAVSHDLCFHTHNNCIIFNARQRSSTLLWAFLSRWLDIMRTAFITYIRLLLEYDSVVWNPCHKYLIDSLENVQRNFSKQIPTLSSYSYYERLAMLNLEPLEIRRLRFDLT
jgi:hypothetical protein